MSTIAKSILTAFLAVLTIIFLVWATNPKAVPDKVLNSALEKEVNNLSINSNMKVTETGWERAGDISRNLQSRRATLWGCKYFYRVGIPFRAQHALTDIRLLIGYFLLAGLLAGTPALAAEKAKAQEVKVGDSVTVGKLYPNVFRMRSDPMYSQLYYFGFITDAVVMNPEGIGKFKFMDECRFGHPQDRVTVVAKDPGRKRVLVKYAQNKVEDYPYCPSGTLFFVPEMEFAKVLALACKEKKEYEAERQKVKQLLGE